MRLQAPVYPNPHTTLLRDHEQVAMIFATDYLIKLIQRDHVQQGRDPALVDVHNIGQGSCYHWAMIVYLASDPGRVTLCSTSDFAWHAFVKIGRLYYDAANMQGVADWRDLNRLHWNTKGPDFIVEQSKEAFISSWPMILSHQALWEDVTRIMRPRVQAAISTNGSVFLIEDVR